MRARARLTLVEEPDPARAWAALASGSKSLLFQFSAAPGFSAELVSLGAMVTTPDQNPLAWGDIDRQVLLNFWDDAARLHVHDVRGREKVPVYGRIRVPAGGQLKVPVPRSSCRPGS